MLALARTRFFGRTAERERIASALAPGVLLTLLGPPGVGKTRLALELLSPLADRFASIVRCDLAGAASRVELTSVVATEIGVRSSELATLEALERAMGEALAARDGALVFLDNAEHIVEHVAALVERLSALAPRAAFLVTSRVALRVPSETIVSLSGLGTSDAAQLFEDRARAIDRPLDEALHRGALDTITRALDGIPLAIELAAVRLRVLSLRELAERLPTQIAILRAQFDPESARHGSVSAAVEYSLELLDASERAGLAQATVFAAPFSPAAAEAVLDVGSTPGRVLITVERWIDHSLVVREERGDGSRYRLLVTIREVARQHLAAADAIAARRRHAAYFLGVARDAVAKLETPQRSVALDALRDVLAELLVAHRFALGDDPDVAVELAVLLDRFLHIDGPFPVRFRVLDETVEIAERARHRELVPRFFIARGTACLDAGRLAEAERDFERARDVGLARGNEGIAGRAEFHFGNVALWDGRLAEARARFERAVRAVRPLGDELLTASALNNLALLVGGGGEYAAARALYQEAIATARRASPHLGAKILANVAQLHHLEGDGSRARTIFADAELETTATGDRFYCGVALIWRTWLEIDEGDVTAATAALARARDAISVLGDSTLDGLARTSEAILLAIAGDADASKRCFVEARTKLEIVRDPGSLEGHAILEGFHDLAAARSAGASVRAVHVDRARERLIPFRRRIEKGEIVLSESRVPMRLLARAIERALATDEPAALEVASDGTWARLRGGAPLDLARRGPLRRLLFALVKHRLESPGESLSPARAFAAGWPGVKKPEDQARKRLYVAIHSLRRLGLGAHLQNRADGYLIDPALPVIEAARS